MPRGRILITEDEAVVAEDLRVTLTGLGYEVAGIASSKADALALTERTRPDLVLMDIKLKGDGDGIGAAAEINERHRIPIVFLTAHADGATLARAKDALPFGYLVKPFDEQSLHASIETALRLHEAQTALSRVEHWLTTTLCSIGDAVVSVDAASRITFLNPSAEQLTGWTSSDAIGQPFEKVVRLIDEKTREPLAALAERAMTLGARLNLAAGALLVARDGREMPIDDSAAPLREHDGRVSGAVFVFRDISQARQQAQEREHMQRRIQEAQRLESLGLVAGGVAHDFNNLLTAILGNSQLARGILPLDSQAAPFLHGIDEASQRAAQLCAHMLAYAGRQEAQLAPVELNEIVLSTIQLIRNSLDPRAELVLELAPTLPRASADRTQLQQVVVNLILNAAESLGAKAGIVTITTSEASLDRETLRGAVLGEQWEPGSFVKLDVADTGCGMGTETLSRIFDPFFSTKFTGRGLGLAAVHGIARSHRAPVFVRSKPGGGTRFQIFLPLTDEQPAMIPAEPRRARLRGEGPVLIVEDEPTVLFIISRIAQRMGFVPIATDSGQAALDEIASSRVKPKLVLLDANMPGMDGLATLRKLRALLPDTPVLLVSALPEDAARERFAGEQIAGVLRKPFRPDQLEQKIAEVLA